MRTTDVADAGDATPPKLSRALHSLSFTVPLLVVIAATGCYHAVPTPEARAITHCRRFSLAPAGFPGADTLTQTQAYQWCRAAIPVDE
jgi:hypothetical protein